MYVVDGIKIDDTLGNNYITGKRCGWMDGWMDTFDWLVILISLYGVYIHIHRAVAAAVAGGV